MMNDIDPGLIADFAEEVIEHVASAETVLVRAAAEQIGADDINLLFRSFHSVKGLARVIGFQAAESLAHAAETVLSDVRDGRRPLDERVQNLLLQSLDALKLARSSLLDGIGYAGDDALLAQLQALGDPQAAPQADNPSRLPDHPLADLYFDAGTLDGLVELLEEVLPDIAACIARGADPAAGDVDTLVFALERIDCLGPVPPLQRLKREPSVSVLAECLLALSHLFQVMECDGLAPTLALIRPNLVQALVKALDQGQWSSIENLARILLPRSPYHGVLAQIPRDDCPADLRARAYEVTAAALRSELGGDDNTPPSELGGLAATEMRNELAARLGPPDAAIKILGNRRIDPHRFRAAGSALAQRLARLQDASGEFFEVRFDVPPASPALIETARILALDWDPLLAETALVDGVQCLCLLVFSDLSEDNIRARLDNVPALPVVVGVTKMNGQQGQVRFTLIERREGAAVGSGIQVRVPVALLDTMFGRLGQFFGVMTRFNALVLDNEVPAALRELSDYAVLHAPHLAAKVDLLARQHRDLSTIEAEAHRLLSVVHETTLGLRVIPLDTLFSRFPRMVRDTAQQTGKQVRFDARANGIRVDNGMLELLSDPLMHMLRNSIDHGVEPPADRAALGKPAQATVIVSAEQRGNHIVIEIRDDGRGINIERVLEKAIANDLVSREQAALLTDDQIARFIFAPGFSTAQAVTDTSGRGVGMDVALVNITKLGGKIDIINRPGLGCCFRLEIPLSKAIQSMLLADTGIQKVAFPDRTVSEVVICATDGVQLVNGQRSMLLHDRFLPLFRLVDLLGLPPGPPRIHGDFSVVVCEHDGQRIGVEVAAILRRADLLIQEMHPRIAHLPGIGGISTIGTDKIVIVVDPDGLFALARQAAVFGLRSHDVRVAEGLF